MADATEARRNGSAESKSFAVMFGMHEKPERPAPLHYKGTLKLMDDRMVFEGKSQKAATGVAMAIMMLFIIPGGIAGGAVGGAIAGAIGGAIGFLVGALVGKAGKTEEFEIELAGCDVRQDKRPGLFTVLRPSGRQMDFRPDRKDLDALECVLAGMSHDGPVAAEAEA